MDKVFYIALGTFDWRIVEIKHIKAVFKAKIKYFSDNLNMDGRITNYALFAHLFPACLKLRFD